jgi:hypothetical protein
MLSKTPNVSLHCNRRATRRGDLVYRVVCNTRLGQRFDAKIDFWHVEANGIEVEVQVQ